MTCRGEGDGLVWSLSKGLSGIDMVSMPTRRDVVQRNKQSSKVCYNPTIGSVKVF